MTQSTKLDFTDQEVFVGLDISKKSWKVCIYVGPYHHRTFTQPPWPDILVRYLRTNFPGARYHCVYEAGYFGFWIHEAFRVHDIECIVVNPADVPTAHWEKNRKSDRVDANKLARSLANGSQGQIRPLYVPDRMALENRTLVRMRSKLVRHQTQCKNRIKAHLHYYGIGLPDGISDRSWNRNYLTWLEQIRMRYPSGDIVLRLMLRQLTAIRDDIAQITRQIRQLAAEGPYRDNVALLCTVPGITSLTAMILLTELCSIDRFASLDALASYVGLVPGEHSSGERQVNTGLTHRGNSTLRYTLVESAWVAVRKDPALMMCFTHWATKMPKTKAIVKIARKLLSRVRYVLRHREPYRIGIVQSV